MKRALSMAVVCLCGSVLACQDKPAAPSSQVQDARDEQEALISAPAVPLDAVASPRRPERPKEAGMLWAVHHKSGRRSVLMGTIHVGIQADKELAPWVWREFDASTHLVVETDPGEISPSEIVGSAMLEPGQSLKAMIKPESYKVLRKRAPLSLSLALERFQPWFVVLQLQLAHIERGEPMDLSLLKRAREAQAKVTFLESASDQLRRMQLVYDAQALERILEEDDTFRQDIARLIELYRQGEVAPIEAMVFDDKGGDPWVVRQLELIIFQRNALWMPALRKHLSRGKVFVAVGLAHLLGPRGLLAQLREEGYRIERLRD